MIGEKKARYAETINLLLEHGADVYRAADQDALFYAAAHGEAEIIELLLANGAEKNWVGDDILYRDFYRFSPLYVAVHENHAAAVKSLLQHSQVMRKTWVLQRYESLEENTLVRAAANGNAEILRMLIDAAPANSWAAPTEEHRDDRELVIERAVWYQHREVWEVFKEKNWLHDDSMRGLFDDAEYREGLRTHWQWRHKDAMWQDAEMENEEVEEEEDEEIC